MQIYRQKYFLSFNQCCLVLLSYGLEGGCVCVCVYVCVCVCMWCDMTWNLSFYLVHQNCCLFYVAFVNKNCCWHFTGYHVLIFTLAFSTWIYLMHCFITKKFSNFILIVSEWSALYVWLKLIISSFRTCVPREKAGFFFFFFLREQWKLIILLYNAVVLSTWLRHYSLASVISLCLKLFNSDNNSSEEYNYSTRILCIRTWSVSYFSCLFGGDVAAYWWLSIPP